MRLVLYHLVQNVKQYFVLTKWRYGDLNPGFVDENHVS